MPTYKRLLLLLTVMLVVATTTTVSALREGEPRASGNEWQAAGQGQQQRDDAGVPAVDYDAPEPSSQEERARRRKRSARYDKSIFVRKEDATGDAVSSTHFSDWELGLSALPAGRSELVIVGEVTEARAHLSNDKTGIYSEFTTRVSQLLENNSLTPLALGDLISLEREGGAVRYPNGRRYLHRISGQNMPRNGRRYLFFVNGAGAEQGFRILTAYELKEGKVFPLDSAQQFDAFRGVEESKFMEAVRGAIGRNQE